MGLALSVQKTDSEEAIRSAKNWQKQADSVTEDSTNLELTDAFIDWGIAQGFLNYARKVKLISWSDYEQMSKKQLLIRNKLNHLLRKRSGLNNLKTGGYSL